MNETFEVRDGRSKEMFRINDEYLDGYASLCGANATLVYMCLCRHADREQESFPSVEKMAEKLGVSRDSVIRGIKKLIEWNIISKKRERKSGAKWLNNRYVLLDKSVWKSNQVANSDMAKLISQVANNARAKSQILSSQVAVSDTKDTHTKDTHIRDTAETSSAPDISKKKKWKTEDPMSLKEFIGWCRISPQKHVRIIGEWAEGENPTHTTYGQWKSFIKRNLRAAQILSPYPIEKIEKAYQKLQDDLVRKDSTGKKIGFITKYTLETLTKYIDLV